MSTEIDRQLISFYSVTPDNECVADTSQLKYARSASRHELPFDLNENIVKYGQSNDGQFQHFLEHVKDNEDLSGEELSFACTNGLYALLQDEDIYLSACLHRNTIYLRTEKVRGGASDANFVDNTQSWTMKFQQFMQSDTRDGEPDTEKPAFGIEEFIGVYRASLGDHTVVYTGNIQAVRVLEGCPDWKELSRAEVLKELSKSELVDLHTTAFAKTNRQTYAYKKFISHKFWTHAYLLGTTEMVIGQRTGEGILMKPEELTTDDMINLGKEHWNYKKSITLCEKTLTKIKAAFLEKINNLDPYQDAPTVKMFFKNNRYGISEVTPLQAKNFPKIDL